MNILCPGKSYSKMYETEPRYHDIPEFSGIISTQSQFKKKSKVQLTISSCVSVRMSRY